MKTKQIWTFLLCFVITMGLMAQEVKNVTICWDVSYSMQDRDLEKEYYFLDAYFKTVQDAQVSVLAFSDEVISKNDFTVRGSDWEMIKKKLNTVPNDGATSYGSLQNYVGSGEVLLFTDGHQNMGTLAPNFNRKVFVINSQKDFDRGSLNLLTIVNNGNLINLAEKVDAEHSKKSKVQYSGTVYDGTTGLAEAEIFIKGFASKGVKSDKNGRYAIEANIGDTLVVAFGNKRKELTLTDSHELDFSFIDKGIVLQEVVVSEQKTEETQYVTTGYGLENKDKIGYAVQSISEKDIPEASTTAGNAIQGKFSGTRLGQNDQLSQITMRPSNSILGNNYGLIVIDGVPMERSDSSFVGLGDAKPEASSGNSVANRVAGSAYIDPRNIAEITVLKGLAATNRYGSMGSNGVLLITTKTAMVNGPRGKKKDLALLTNNVYDGKLKVSSKSLVTPYLKELKSGKSIRDAYDIYLVQREKYTDSPEYLVDVASFFYGSNPDLGNRILSNVLEKPKSSYEELRGMYLKSMELGNHEMALLAANKMVADFPNRIQPYLDAAMAQEKTGGFQLASNLYSTMLNGSANKELNFIGLEKLVGANLRNLVNQKRKYLDFSKVPASYQNNLTYNARLVLEWSNTDAEFVVQFVNPQKRFFNWEHTDTSNRNRILDELEHGFSSEQFEIVGPETVGDWILNVTYLGNRNSTNKTPTFLKCTVQHNFGKANQHSEEFMVRLQENGDEQQLAKFSVE